MAWVKAEGTKHSDNCKAAFGRRDATCPRCQELTAGAPARSGWGSDKRRWEVRQIADIKAHDCKASKCGPVCTFGDW